MKEDIQSIQLQKLTKLMLDKLKNSIRLSKSLYKQLNHEKDSIFILRKTTEEKLVTEKLKLELSLIEKMLDFIELINVYPTKEKLHRWSNNFLSDLGVEVISPNDGENFNDKLHEVLSTVDSNNNLTVGKMLKVGYSYKNKVIRRSLVEVIAD